MITFIPYQNSSRYNFGTLIPTRDVISVAAGRHLSASENDALNAVNTIAGREVDCFEIYDNQAKTTKGLINQFPILETVVNNVNKFFVNNENRTPKEIDAFIKEQVELVGENELDVQPVKI